MSARRRIRWAAIAGITLAGLSAGAYWGLHQALHSRPDFYAAAVAIPLADQQQAGHEFERGILALHNDVQQTGRWKSVFTDAQINGWLAVDLPEKFPDLLPTSIRQPRVALTPRQLHIAFQYETDQLSTVVSLCLEVMLADEPNTLSICIRQAHAGWIPLPLKDFLDQISQAARNADIVLRWAQQDGAPVALVTVPKGQEDGEQNRFLLQLIEIGQGALTIAGEAGLPADE